MQSCPSCEFAIAVAALACSIARNKTPEEIALISSIFLQLADTLGTITAYEAFCCPDPPSCDKCSGSADNFKDNGTNNRENNKGQNDKRQNSESQSNNSQSDSFQSAADSLRDWIFY
jgi:NifU-like protein involved in Fe-S cluster formation